MAGAAAPSQETLSRRGVGLGARLILFGVVAPAGAMGLGLLTALFGLFSASADGVRRFFASLGRPHAALFAYWAFIAWAGFSFAWSPTHDVEYAGVLLGIAILPPLLGWVATTAADYDRTIVRRAAVCCFAILFVGLMVEAIFAYPISKISTEYDDVGALIRNLARGGVCALALCFVAAAAAWRLTLKRAVVASILVAGAVVSFQFNVIANPVGYFAGVAGAGVALLLPRAAIMSVFAGAAALVMSAPWLYPAAAAFGRSISPNGELSLSNELRARMWDFAAARIFEHPILGWGFQSARTFDEPIVVRGWTVTRLQIHPHSAPLQVWLETGLIGASFAAIALLLAGWTLSKSLAKDKVVAAALVGSATILLTVYAFSYSIWDDWLVALISVVGAILIASRANVSEQNLAKSVSKSEFEAL
jgi:O-antigen ligase